jgi:Protein of unknown function (DUF998)
VSHHVRSSTAQRDLLTSALLACGVIGPSLFVVVFLILGLTQPGYNPLRHWVSEFSLGPTGWINNANLIVSGVFVVAYGYGLKRIMRSGVGAFWGPTLIVTCGLSMILAGVFVTDPTGNYPFGVARLETPSIPGIIHDIAGPSIMLSMSAACFVFARRFSNLGWVDWARYSRLTGWLIPISFTVCSTLVGLEFSRVLPGAPSGLFQRIALILGMVWMARLAHRLCSA